MWDIIVAAGMWILGHTPVLLACLVGMITALLFRRRTRTVSLLVLLGAGLLFAITVIQPLATQYILHSQQDWGWSHKTLSLTLSVLGMGISVVHAISIAMLIVAAFVGRPKFTEGS